MEVTKRKFAKRDRESQHRSQSGEFSVGRHGQCDDLFPFLAVSLPLGLPKYYLHDSVQTVTKCSLANLKDVDWLQPAFQRLWLDFTGGRSKIRFQCHGAAPTE